MTSIEALGVDSYDQEALNRVYESVVPTDGYMKQLAKDHEQIFTLPNGDRFSATVFTPEDPDGSVILSGREYGWGSNHPEGLLRDLGMQALLPNTIVVSFPNDQLKFGGSHTNLSFKEKVDLMRRGNFDPYIARYDEVLNQLPRDSKDAKDAPVALVGLSQGTVIAGEYGRHPDSRATSAVLLEAPNAGDHTSFGMIKDFFQANDYEKARNQTYADFEGADEIKNYLREKSEGFNFGYVSNFVRLGNVALFPSMTQATLTDQIGDMLDKKNMAVMHGWGTEGAISRDEDNQSVAAFFESLNIPLYEAHRFEGIGHELTNYNLIVSALARRAFLLPLLKTA